MQPGRADGAGHRGAQDGIAVVKVPVLVRAGFERVRAAPKFCVCEDQSPIATRGLGFKVVRVAGTDAGGSGDQAAIGAVQLLKQAALGANLGLYDLRPEALACDRLESSACAARRSVCRLCACSGRVMATGR